MPKGDYDFVVADNAEPPFVGVYEVGGSGEVAAAFYLKEMTLAQATQLAEVAMNVLTTKPL